MRDENFRNEDPSDDDLARFADDTAHCPYCGAEVWDQAEVCPQCGQYIAGDTVSAPTTPAQRSFNQRWTLVLIIILIIALLIIMI